jgi:non-lysosomal glucosylceramidase
MLEMNGSVSRFGAVNAVLPDGSVDRSNSHSGNVWPGATYALASLAIYEGMVDEGLELARKVWANIADNVKNPWDQPDVIDSVTGKYGFGDHYMRNMVVWALAFALSKHEPGVKQALDALKPSPS